MSRLASIFVLFSSFQLLFYSSKLNSFEAHVTKQTQSSRGIARQLFCTWTKNLLLWGLPIKKVNKTSIEDDLIFVEFLLSSPI